MRPLFRREALRARAAPIVEHVSATPLNGSAQYSVSDNGTVVHLEATLRHAESPLRWLEASGRLMTLRPQATEWERPSFSPDGTKLAMSIVGGPLRAGTDIWIHEPERDLMMAPYMIERTSFRAGGPRQWSPEPIGASDRGYALHPDGNRMIVGAPDSVLVGRSTVAIAFNFFDELRRKAPVK